jgi:hypothetical protein
LGLHTIQFIQFYFPGPEGVLSLIDKDYIREKRYQRDVADIVFLHQENLNEELYNFLLGLGYSRKDIRFIREVDRVNVTAREASQFGTWDFYTQELVEDVLNKDELLFEVFPEYGVVPA